MSWIAEILTWIETSKGESKMEYQSEDIVVIKVLKQAVESEGCELAKVDLENNVLKVDGPDEVIAGCARAVAEMFD